MQLERRVGAAFLLLLGGAVAAVLLLSGRTIGRGAFVDVEFASTGALRAGGKLRIAGQEIGEVRGLHGIELVAPAAGRRVIAHCFVSREWLPHVYRGSDLFVATPSVLGEAYLEVGPAREPLARPCASRPSVGVAREPAETPVADGDCVRGSDPPELDQLIPRLYADLTTVMVSLRPQRAVWDELIAAGDSLLTTWSGITTDPGQLKRIRDELAAAWDNTATLVTLVDDMHAVRRARTVAADLAATATRVGPELSALATKAAAAVDRLDSLRDTLPPERRERLRAAADTLAHAATTAIAVATEVQRLADRVARGEGSLGAFVADKELYDDLHEVHRILKSQPWTLIVKPPKGQKTIAR